MEFIITLSNTYTYTKKISYTKSFATIFQTNDMYCVLYTEKNTVGFWFV